MFHYYDDKLTTSSPILTTSPPKKFLISYFLCLYYTTITTIEETSTRSPVGGSKVTLDTRFGWDHGFSFSGRGRGEQVMNCLLAHFVFRFLLRESIFAKTTSGEGYTPGAGEGFSGQAVRGFYLLFLCSVRKGMYRFRRIPEGCNHNFFPILNILLEVLHGVCGCDSRESGTYVRPHWNATTIFNGPMYPGARFATSSCLATTCIHHCDIQ